MVSHDGGNGGNGGADSGQRMVGSISLAEFWLSVGAVALCAASALACALAGSAASALTYLVLAVIAAIVVAFRAKVKLEQGLKNAPSRAFSRTTLFAFLVFVDLALAIMLVMSIVQMLGLR